MPRQTFGQDLMELAAQEMVAGRLSRRDFLSLLGATGAAAAFGVGTLSSSPVMARAKEIVIANHGGDAVNGMAEAWGVPFTADTDIPVRVDGAGPLAGKITAMVESGAVAWDVCDGDGFLCGQLGKKGLLENVDYSIVDKSMIREGWA